MQLARSGEAYHYTLKNLQEIFDLSLFLAKHFPDPDQVMTGIYELLLNAIEHGNLALGCEEKYRLVQEGKWEEEITRRLSLPQNKNKHVAITIVRNTDECSLTIADQGKGFQWQEYVRQGANPRAPHGRGLLIAFSSGFDRITFNEAGNIVTCAITGT